MVRVCVLAVVVFLIAGAVPAFSASSAPRATVHTGVTIERVTRSSGQATLPRALDFAPPLRVPDPAAYAQKKAQAESGYQSWLQNHGGSAKAAGPSRLTSVAGSLLNEPGLTSADPSNASTPPDTTGAAGPSNYVEMVNSEVAVYSNSDLTTPTATLDQSSFFGSSYSTCDGNIQWDAQGHRWLYSGIACDSTADSLGDEQLYFGWSKTASPDLSASNWCNYALPTGANLEDYPKLGHDDSQVLIGTNEFAPDGFGGFYYNDSFVYVVDKPAPGDTSCPSLTTLNNTGRKIQVGGFDSNFNLVGGYTPVPANIADSSADGYVAAIDFGQAHIDLYSFGRDGSNNNVELGSTSVTVPAFCFPANVPQPGTTNVLDDLDTRLTQAVAVTDPNTGQEGIWTQHTVAQGCSRGTPSGPSVVRWYELTPGATTPAQTGTVQGPNGSFAFMGAISPTSDGNNAAIFYNSGSSTQLPDFRVADRHLDTASGRMIEDLQLASSVYADQDKSCTSPYGPPCRWGDYTGASPDPSSPNFVWGSGELTPIASDLLSDPQWGTENAAIDVTPAANYPLHVATIGGGSGAVSDGSSINCPGTCSHSYAYGTPVTLTATPAAHSVFAGWSGDCTGTGTCQVPMGGPQSVTATFRLETDTLSVSKSGAGSGSVASNDGGISCGSACSADYSYGSSVTLTATPSTGSSFTGWSGGGCSGTGNCTVSMTAATAVTARFALIPETLTVTKSGTGSGTVTSDVGGIDCGSTCSHDYTYGTSVTLTATPAAHTTFDGWSGACSGTATCTVPMNAARSVTATFTQILCVVPKVKGKTVAEARAAIGSANCSVGGITKKTSKTVKKGRVISQSRAAGSRLAYGAAVHLVVSKGKPKK